MFAARRIAGRSVQQVRIPRAYSTGPPSKDAHTDGHGHAKDGHEVHHFAGTSTEHGEHHSGPVNESLGTQFYFVLALIPASFALYSFSGTNKDGKPAGLSKLIDSYAQIKEKWLARNNLHTAMVEQAGFDKNLFHNAQGSSHINLKFPEVFNTGAPHNLVAGQSANLDELVAHYEKINNDAEANKVKKLQEKK